MFEGVINYDQLISTKKVMDMSEQWITVREAFPLLKVTTTQGVWNVIQRANRYHELTVQKRNIGTAGKPRYLLLKTDVEIVAKAMGKS